MAIKLKKGERTEIKLTHLIVELGWKVNPNANPPYDLDASTFLLNRNQEIGAEYDFVFYGSPNKKQFGTDSDGNPIMRPVSVDGSVVGSVDDLGDDDDNTGEGNEVINVDLTKVSPSVEEILFTVSIYWEPGLASARYNFGQVRNAYIQIKNQANDEVICRYDLDEDFSTMKGVEFGRLYRRGGEWRFHAIGEGVADGLEPICQKYASRFM